MSTGTVLIHIEAKLPASRPPDLTWITCIPSSLLSSIWSTIISSSTFSYLISWWLTLATLPCDLLTLTLVLTDLLFNIVLDCLTTMLGFVKNYVHLLYLIIYDNFYYSVDDFFYSSMEDTNVISSLPETIEISLMLSSS